MLISQHINFSRLNNKQHKAQAACLCLGRHVCSAGLLPSGGEHHYAQVNETKEKSIDSTFEKENTEDRSGQGDLSVPDGVWHSGLEKAEEKGSILSGPSPEQNPSRLTEVERFRRFLNNSAFSQHQVYGVIQSILLPSYSSPGPHRSSPLLLLRSTRLYIRLMFSYYMHGLIPPSSVPNSFWISESTPHFTNQNLWHNSCRPNGYTTHLVYSATVFNKSLSISAYYAALQDNQNAREVLLTTGATRGAFLCVFARVCVCTRQEQERILTHERSLFLEEADSQPGVRLAPSPADKLFTWRALGGSKQCAPT